jgi:hypothetical protein
MPRRALTTIAASALLAVTPASAFAQGAGDEQYQDPLTAPSAPAQPQQTQTTTAPSSTTPAATAAPAATSAPTSTQAASSQELPRTGAPAGLIGMAGATLILSGAALRRRIAAQ